MKEKDGSEREPIDSAFLLLSDEYRRDLCQYVATVDRTVFSTAELIDHLRTQRSEVDRERLRVELTHVHLPMMAEEGVIEYDRRQGTVMVEDPGFVALCANLEAAIADAGCAEAN